MFKFKSNITASWYWG